MTDRIRIVGLLRFSILAPTYNTERFDSLEAVAAHLFSPERMALRFHLFERLCLPSLVAQSDPDFDAVVLTARAMPERFRSRLRAILEPYPNLHFRAVGEGRHYGLLRRGYESVPLEGAGHRVMFRLDDDDALDRGFIARLRRLAEGLLPVLGPQTPFIIAQNRGFYLRAAGRETEVFDTTERAPLSTGAALVAPAGFPHNPYRFNHRKYAQHFSTFTDISEPAFIRTIHRDNKSDPAQMGLTRQMDADAIEAELRHRFGFGISELEAIGRGIGDAIGGDQPAR
ncbi:glycosyltransferase [Pontibaca methylaminivorans]|uniref:Putative rhamnosyl transferase n=1 Tax=Pontibaca methylaminivorans TaxID=515897 RepID=A0A1R3WN16_9RHOB|nr:glycosyltransferase [Pontibaca methylaminivorans]SIT79307.1 Putative rhamnosyl transferase [Pontibaca methylaminivorans]